MRNIALTMFLLGLSAGMGAASAQAADRISVPVSGLSIGWLFRRPDAAPPNTNTLLLVPSPACSART